jgi:hypothetical protein
MKQPGEESPHIELASAAKRRWRSAILTAAARQRPVRLVDEDRKKERKKTDHPREGWEDGTPPPHRDFKERCVVR